MAFGEVPERLPGPSANTVMVRSVPFILATIPCLPAIAVQAYVPAQALWVTIWVMVIFTLVGLFVRGLKRTRDLERAEITRGYTTMLQVAADQPQLWLLHAKTGVPLSAPWEPRPSDLRAATVETWLAKRS